VAVRSGSVEIVDALLKAGAQKEVQNSDGSTPLHVAVIRGSVEIVDALLKAGAQIEVQNRYGLTPLHVAVIRGSVEIVDALLKAGAQIEVQNTEKGMIGDVALLEGVIKRKNQRNLGVLHEEEGKVKEAKQYYELSADQGYADAQLKVQSIGGYQAMQGPLDTLSENGLALPDRAVHILHENQASSSNTLREIRAEKSLADHSDSADWGDIHRACYAGDVEAIRRIILHSAVHVNDVLRKSGETPLMIAARKGHKEVCRLLLSIDTLDKDALDVTGQSALDKADNLDIMTMLIEAGLSYRNQRNRALLLKRACLIRNTTLLKSFFDLWNDYDKQDEDGNTVLHIACLEGYKDVTQFLLESYPGNTIGIDLKNSKGLTAFQLIDEKKKELKKDVHHNREQTDLSCASISYQMHEKHADEHSAAQTSKLLEAIYENKLVWAQHALDEGADIHFVDEFDRTPLHWAALKGSVELLILLCNRKARIDAQDKEGYTALHVAAAHGYHECAAELLDRGADKEKTNNDGKNAFQLAQEKNHIDLADYIHAFRKVL
jgi:serine/threonine-protein phosphatase 6 regulatory ankyrin repeat subunit B